MICIGFGMVDINFNNKVMNDQLKRIREKDYSQMDQKLLENMTRADNLNSTLFQLSDFQNFLIEQIALLNQEKNPSAKSNQISKSLIKNFDCLKESIVNCSRIRERVEIKTMESLKNSLKQTKKQLNEIKRQVQKDIKKAVEQNCNLCEKYVGEIIRKYEAEKCKNQDLSKRLLQLQQQKLGILQENQELKQKLAAKHASKNHKKSGSVRLEEKQSSPLLQLSQYDANIVNSVHLITDKSFTSLKKVIPAEINKLISNQFSVNRQSNQSERPIIRQNSLKRFTVNHQMQRKQHIQIVQGKQNETVILRSKGVKIQEPRPKSKQKIKLFSMY